MGGTTGRPSVDPELMHKEETVDVPGGQGDRQCWTRSGQRRSKLDTHGPRLGETNQPGVEKSDSLPNPASRQVARHSKSS
jgi:hypothetical protein